MPTGDHIWYGVQFRLLRPTNGYVGISNSGSSGMSAIRIDAFAISVFVVSLGSISIAQSMVATSDMVKVMVRWAIF